MSNPIPAKVRGAVELKVKAATWATFLLSLAASTFLATTATDYVTALPDWLEVPAYSLVMSAGTFVSGYLKRSQPDSLSASTVKAVQEWMREHMPRKPLS